jgi:hypothetical protein
MLKRVILGFAATMLFVGRVGTVEAGVVAFDLDTKINGSTPTGTAPWLTATFTDINSTTVELTMTNNMPSTNFVSTWLFNYTGSAPTAAFVSGQAGISGTPTIDATQDLAGGNNIKAGLFNIKFDFSTSNSNSGAARFSGGETSVYDFTRASGLTASDFQLFSINKPNPNGSLGGWYSAAEVQGFGNGLSGSIGAKTEKETPAAPEPGSLTLLGLGLASFGAVGWVKKRKTKVGAF